jgi:TIR domain
VRKIFISYRRSDTLHLSLYLFEKIRSEFGNIAIIDVDAIPSGVDFRSFVAKSIADCGIFMAIIGNDWASNVGDSFRICHENDYVKIEIEEALGQRDVTIYPIYVDIDNIDNVIKLPASIENIKYINAKKIKSDINFSRTILEIILDIYDISYRNYFIKRLVKLKNTIKNKYIYVALYMAVATAIAAPMFGDQRAINFILSIRNSALFSVEVDKGGSYRALEIARALPGRSALENEQNTGDIIANANESFDIYTDRGNYIYVWEQALGMAAARGARIRVLLTDYSSPGNLAMEMRALMDNELDPIQRSGFARAEFEQNIEKINGEITRINNIGRKSGGHIELRTVDIPFRNSFWVRDGANEERAIGHVDVVVNNDARSSPVFRVGRESYRTVRILQQEFDWLWAMSKEIQ